MVRVRRIDEDTRRETRWRRTRKCIDADESYRWSWCIPVFRNEDTSTTGSNPKSTGVLRRARNRRDATAGPRRAAIIGIARRQIRRPCRSKLEKVTASRKISAGHRQEVTVRFQSRLLAAPILCPPYADQANEGRLSSSRIWIGH